MSETVARHRPSIDLDDFERRMRQPAGLQHQANPQGAPYEDDPLAELARLVGEQHDPYGDVFAREAVAQPGRSDDRREPAFGRGVDFAAIEAGLRGALPAHPDDHGHDNRHAHEQHDQDQHGYDRHGYAEPAFEHDPYAEAPQDWQNHAQPRVQGKSRRPVYAMIATIAIGVIGIGVAFAFKGTSSSPREIKTIMAASGPTKIQPPADASADEATQDAGGIGKSQLAPTKLATREEQPVDLSQAVQDNTARDAASQQGAAGVAVPLSPGQMRDGTASPDYSSLGGTSNAAPASDGTQGFGAGMPAPKKVKVVSVRPDGTIMSNDVGVPSASNDPVSLAPATSSQDAPKPEVAKSDTPKLADKPTKKSAKMTSRVTPKPVDITSAAAGDDAAPAPKPTKPAKKPKPTRVATADTGDQPAQSAAAPESAATDTEPKASSGGGFAVQFAAPTTEAEAKAASAKFGKKFATALDGRRLGFHKADSNGRSVYRVRSGGLSREDATSLCDKVKADGGTCFVAKS